ncbi:hypothetical protein M9458_041811, partial [Cirrhinus mrigala]
AVGVEEQQYKQRGAGAGSACQSLLHLRQPHFLKFNISLGKDALFGVYMRKGLPPSHAQ